MTEDQMKMFSELVEQHRSELVRRSHPYASKVSNLDADDLVQLTCMKMMNSPLDIKTPAELIAIFERNLNQCFIDGYRGENRLKRGGEKRDETIPTACSTAGDLPKSKHLPVESYGESIPGSLFDPSYWHGITTRLLHYTGAIPNRFKRKPKAEDKNTTQGMDEVTKREFLDGLVARAGDREVAALLLAPLRAEIKPAFEASLKELRHKNEEIDHEFDQRLRQVIRDNCRAGNWQNLVQTAAEEAEAFLERCKVRITPSVFTLEHKKMMQEAQGRMMLRRYLESLKGDERAIGKVLVLILFQGCTVNEIAILMDCHIQEVNKMKNEALIHLGVKTKRL